MPSKLRPIESCAKEEAYRRSRTIELRRLCTLLCHMHLETAYVFRSCGIGRPTQELGKLHDVAEIVPRGRFAQISYPHVPQHASGQFGSWGVCHSRCR